MVEAKGSTDFINKAAAGHPKNDVGAKTATVTEKPTTCAQYPICYWIKIFGDSKRKKTLRAAQIAEMFRQVVHGFVAQRMKVEKFRNRVKNPQCSKEKKWPVFPSQILKV